MNQHSNFHPPVSLSEYRARKQRPYPAVFEMPTSDEIAEADEQHAIARGNRWARTLMGFTCALLLIALGVHLYFR